MTGAASGCANRDCDHILCCHAGADRQGALRRLAMQQLEPTPEHFAEAYAQEAGQPAPEDPGRAWASLIERLARGLERGGRHWTGARKKQSLQRVLDGSRSDSVRLQQRLGQLMAAWDDDQPAGEVEPSGASATEPDHGAGLCEPAHDGADWQPVLHEVRATLAVALPSERPDAAALADALAAAAQRLADEGPAGRVAARDRRAVRGGARTPVAPPPPARRADAAVPRDERRHGRAGRGRKLGARPVRCAARAAGRRP